MLINIPCGKLLHICHHWLVIQRKLCPIFQGNDFKPPWRATTSKVGVGNLRKTRAILRSSSQTDVSQDQGTKSTWIRKWLVTPGFKREVNSGLLGDSRMRDPPLTSRPLLLSAWFFGLAHELGVIRTLQHLAVSVPTSTQGPREGGKTSDPVDTPTGPMWKPSPGRK